MQSKETKRLVVFFVSYVSVLGATFNLQIISLIRKEHYCVCPSASAKHGPSRSNSMGFESKTVDALYWASLVCPTRPTHQHIDPKVRNYISPVKII